MTPANGSKVGIREFYAELQKQSGDRAEMERRLVEAFNKAVDRLDEKYDKRLCGAEENIVSLRVADRKWGGMTAIVAAAFTGIGTAFGVYLKK